MSEVSEGSVNGEVMKWLEGFAACVRERRYADARERFSRNVVAFGTTARHVDGLAELEREQWRSIWEASTDFRFVFDELRVFGGGPLVVAAVPFESVGYDAESSPFQRPGRATLVLAREGERLLAVHSHFSLDPGVPTQTHPPRPNEPR